MKKIDNLVRHNIKELVPYSSAREEYKGDANIWLDANENPFDTTINRYPDPYQMVLKNRLSIIKDIPVKNIFLGNGSDEIIDLLFRGFCEPGIDKTVTFSPTYGMYKVLANINNIEIVDIPLDSSFALPPIDKTIQHAKLIFICSPNNPTGNAFSLDIISNFAKETKGIVIVDEAYVDFSTIKSASGLINKFPNIVVLQTLSKAYGMAGLRVGMAFGNEKIIEVLNRIKPPYNINTLSQKKAIKRLKNRKRVLKQIKTIKAERSFMVKKLAQLSIVEKLYPSEANFLLVKFSDPQKVMQLLQNNGIIIRDRTQQVRGCLRISIGTKNQNNKLLEILNTI